MDTLGAKYAYQLYLHTDFFGVAESMGEILEQINKEYEKAFILEPSKLRGLQEKVHSRLKEKSNDPIEDYFVAFLADGTVYDTTDIEMILAIENHKKKKINRLKFLANTQKNNNSPTENSITTDFGALKANANKPNVSKVISLIVRSEDANWANKAFPGIEEQVERTFALNIFHQFIYVFTVSMMIMGALLILFSILGPLRVDSSRTMWLRGKDFDYLQQVLSKNHQITDQEFREIYSRQLGNLLDFERPYNDHSLNEKPSEKDSKLSGADSKTQPNDKVSNSASLAVAGLVVFICSLTVILTTPSRVFLWGDEESHHKIRLNIRKGALGIIISIFVVGLVANYLSANLGPALNRSLISQN